MEAISYQTAALYAVRLIKVAFIVDIQENTYAFCVVSS